jgi:hypothetical protein
MIANYRVTSLAALVMACGGVSTETPQEQANPLGSSAEAQTLACVQGTAANGWADGSFGNNSGSFSVEVDATPGSGDEDALVGLAAGAPATYSDLAAIVRFNTDGMIDVRDGASYRADVDVPYRAGEERHLRFDVDTVNHRYSVTDLAGEWGGYSLASGYAFRTERANAPSLAAYGVKVDDGGPLDVCNVIAQSTACAAADAGHGFVNQAFAPQNQFVSIEFDATPSAANIDAVLGVSAAAAGAFNDIAAAVRFNPDGIIDARDGDAYRPITRDVYGAPPVQYTGGTTYNFRLLIDVAAHTYTVTLNGSQTLQNLAFRGQQASASSLGNLVLESDADTGAVTRCNVNVSPARGTAYMHDAAISGQNPLPLPDGRYLDVGATHSTIYDAAGFPAGTAPLSGALAVDASGNLYQLGTFSGAFDPGTGPLTSAGGVDVYLVKYDSAFQPVRASRFGGTDDDSFAGPRVTAAGDVLFVLDQNLVRVDARGDTVYDSVPFGGGLFALAPDGSAIWQDYPGPDRALSITKLDPNGDAAWTHVMPIIEGGVEMNGLVADAFGGAVFAGEIDGKFDLGDGRTFAIEAHEDGEQTYIAKLDAKGAPVYANATTISDFNGLTADGRGNVAVSGSHVNVYRAMVEAYRSDGSLIRELDAQKLLLPAVQLGSSQSGVVTDWLGNLYWTFAVGPTEYGAFFVKIVP